MEYEKLARKHRKKSVINVDSPTLQQVNYGRPDIQKLIPHRDPFLLFDKIESVDLTEKAIIGKCTINPDDPVFAGHFPDYQIYPGVLQVEMIGQVAICFYSLAKYNSVEINEEAGQLGVRALKIYHTLFQHEVLPKDEVTIFGQVLDQDEYTFKGIGQVVKGDNVCTIAIAEFYIV